jgi:hypothetical protein
VCRTGLIGGFPNPSGVGVGGWRGSCPVHAKPCPFFAPFIGESLPISVAFLFGELIVEVFLAWLWHFNEGNFSVEEAATVKSHMT